MMRAWWVVLALAVLAVPADAQLPPVSSATTQVGGTLSATPNTFISVLGQSASIGLGVSGARRGCMFWNTSTVTFLVFFGPTANATAANSFPLGPGNWLNCQTGSQVLQDNIAVSAPLASAPYVLLTQ